jgi:hypothetical protein
MKMRLLSNNEKEVIKQFYTIKNHGGFLYNYFWDQLQNEDLEIDRVNKEIKVVFRTEIKNGPSNEEMKYFLRRIDEIELEVILISNIMNYLENEGYIICVVNSENRPNQETISKILPQGTKVTRTFPDKKINELFINYIDNRVGGGWTAPTSHTTVRTVRYTAVQPNRLWYLQSSAERSSTRRFSWSRL